MELRSILNKIGRKENPFSKLSAAEKSYARIFESTLGADVTPQQLKKARKQMDKLGLSFDQEDSIKTMIMKDRNKSLKNKKNKGKIKKPDVPKLFEDAFKESGINLEDRESRNQNLRASNRQVAINLARRKREREEQFGNLKNFRSKGNNKGGVILKTNKEKMAYGGMASGKKHMYATGGSVKDNAGLRALQKASPMAYNKIKGIV